MCIINWKLVKKNYKTYAFKIPIITLQNLYIENSEILYRVFPLQLLYTSLLMHFGWYYVINITFGVMFK